MFENVLVGVGGADISMGLKGLSHTFLREKLTRGNPGLSDWYCYHRPRLCRITWSLVVC